MCCWSRERPSGANRSCFCCHVRTATVCLGVYNLLVDILNICVTLALVIDPDLARHSGNLVPSHSVIGSDSVNNLSTVNNVSSHANSNWNSDANDAQFVKLVVNFLTAFFSTCLIYGTLKVKPSFLLPYFCVQLFDLCVSCLAVVGCFTNEANVRIFFVMQEWFPMRQHLLALSSGWLMFVAGILAIVYLWVKAYLISVVWNCYKYLVALRRIRPTVIGHHSITDHGLLSDPSTSQPLSSVPSVTATITSTSSVDTQILLPPKYEDIAAFADDLSPYTPPPSYTDVTERRERLNSTEGGSDNDVTARLNSTEGRSDNTLN